MHNFFFMVR